MARPGDTLIDPLSQRRLTFRRTTSQTSGRAVEFDLYYEPREPRAEEHVHHRQEHQVELLAGELMACVGGRVQVLRPGDVLLLCLGDSHAVWNASPRAAHAVWHTFPALDTEACLETTWRAASDLVERPGALLRAPRPRSARAR